jgi:hypothetical protein
MESHALRLRGLLKVTDALLQRHEPGLYLALGLRERASERERERERDSLNVGNALLQRHKPGLYLARLACA